MTDEARLRKQHHLIKKNKAIERVNRNRIPHREDVSGDKLPTKESHSGSGRYGQ